MNVKNNYIQIYNKYNEKIITYKIKKECKYKIL